MNGNLWLDRAPGGVPSRASLPGDRQVDVAIVGAGFTGLWTAYYLQRADPGLRIALLESRFAGFGASGRNGGWCSELFPSSWDKIARHRGRPAALAMKAAMRDAIGQVESAILHEGIECDFARGGTLGFARSAVQLDRAAAEVESARAWGDGEADVRLVDAAEISEMTGAADVLGGTFTPHCAVLDPGGLVRGLAARVVDNGADLFENTTVRSIGAHRLVTDRGTVRADTIVRATEAYTHTLPGHRRELAPVYSLIVATEPLSEDILARVGLAHRPTFTDHRHLVCYGQRTADGRIVFGGRGAPYHLGSFTRDEFDRDPRVFRALRAAVVDLFPALAGVHFTHAWGGPLGVPRDWQAGVGMDRSTGLAWAGGYVGDGVSTSNLAGRTLADLITERDTDLVRLPWVGHHSPRWEPEPLRWLGINAGLRLTNLADRTEARTGHESWPARGLGRLLGQ